jgi:imidazoleglycerol-phosphate dehydratase
MIQLSRDTKETSIKLELDLGSNLQGTIQTSLPFFDHLLTAMCFHGEFFLKIEAKGDIEVDPHHLVEDVGLVFGSALAEYQKKLASFQRFGFALIPMDEALSEVVVDVCGRPTLVFNGTFPQPRAGQFDLFLIREFLLGLVNKSQIALHASCRYGENAHHMVESLFKALGRALKQAYQEKKGQAPSTKGII